MADKISPEERLFKVIQEGKSSSGAKDFKKKRVRIGLRGIRQFFANLKPGGIVSEEPAEAASVALPVKFQEIDLKVINRIFGFILAILIILLIYYVVNERPGVVKITDAISKIKLQTVKRKSIEAFKPLYFYTDEVKKRDIFRPVAREAEKIKVEVKKPKLQELAKDLTLVGIYMGRYPEVMIEVKGEEKTYFLKQGDEIKGIKIKVILEDRVILEYQGEEMDLI